MAWMSPWWATWQDKCSEVFWGSHFQSWRKICNFYASITNETMLCYTIYMDDSFIYSPLIQSTNIEYASGLQARHSVYNVNKHRIGVDSGDVFTYFWQIYHISGSCLIFPAWTKEDTYFLSPQPPPFLPNPDCFALPCSCLQSVLSGLDTLISKLGYVRITRGFAKPWFGWGPRICLSNMFLDEANGENKGLRWWGS